MAQFKINLSFPPSVVERMDKYCKAHLLTRSGFVTMAVDNYLTAHAMADALNELTQTVKRLADQGGGSAEDLDRLEHIEELLQLMRQGGVPKD